MDEHTTIDIASAAFAKRLANLLTDTRTRQGVSLRKMARREDRPFAVGDLKRFEAATMPLDHDIVERVTELYEADLGLILPARLPIVVMAGVVSAGGVRAAFTPHDATSLLEAYLKLVRQLRREHKTMMLELRRHDIDALASYLRQPGETVVERLSALMSASRPQRTAMAALFASGALVIGLVGAVAAAHGAAGDGTTAGSLRADSAPVAAIVAVAAEHGSGPTDAASVAPTNTPVAHAAAASGSDGGVASPENLNAVLDVIGAQVGDSASTPGGSPQRPGGSASASGGSASSGPDQAPTTTVGFHEAGGDGQVVVPAVGATSADTSGDTTTTIAATNTTDTTTPTTSDASAGTGVSKQHTGHHGARHRKGDGEAEQQAAARRKETTRRKAEAEHHAAAGNHQHTPE